MARPLKQGLTYFSLDVDFLRDFKMRKIIRACGISATHVMIVLLSRIYGDNGYYIGWDNESLFLLADEIGVSEGVVAEIVKKAMQVDFFNADMYEKYQILTSKGIQERFFTAAARRKSISVRRDFLLVPVNVYNNLVIDDIMSTETELLYTSCNKGKESKGKKRKVKESKGKESKDIILTGEELEPETQSPYSDIQKMCTSFCRSLKEEDVTILCDLQKKFKAEHIKRAMSIASERGRRSMHYVQGILEKQLEQKEISMKRDFKSEAERWRNGTLGGES